jgi:hypothetical protein
MGNAAVGEKFFQRKPAKDKVAFFQRVQGTQISILKTRITKLRFLLVILAVLNVAGLGYMISKPLCRPGLFVQETQAPLPPAGKAVSAQLAKPLDASVRTGERNGLFAGSNGDRLTDGQAGALLTLSDPKQMAKGMAVVLAGSRSNTANGQSGFVQTAAAANPPHGLPVLVKYVGSKTSNKYHYPHCQWVKQIAPGNVLEFTSVQEAQTRGYVQCRYCQPPLKDVPQNSQQASINQ